MARCQVECPFCRKTRGSPPFVCTKCRTAIPTGFRPSKPVAPFSGRPPASSTDDVRLPTYRYESYVAPWNSIGELRPAPRPKGTRPR
jgi:hypothetical protein